MDSSSEDNFAWTDASNDSADSENMAKSKRSPSPSGEESESGKTYKKKLQQRLFSGGDDKDATSEVPERQKSKKRKMSSQHQSDSDNIESPKKKCVKIEPESDVELPKKKKKKHNSRDDIYDEGFLNAKVENEESFAVPTPVKSKKSKKKSVANGNDTFLTSNGDADKSEIHTLSESKVFSSTQIRFEESVNLDSSHDNEDVENQSIKPKKNKKKSSKKLSRSEVEVNSIEEDSIKAEESAAAEQLLSMAPDELSDSHTPDTTVDGKHEKTKPNKSKNNQDHLLNGNDTDNQTIVQRKAKSLFERRKSKMSERLQFEDDTDDQTKSNTKTVNSRDSTKLKNFIQESSVGLRPLRVKLQSSLTLTDDDDVWLINCPKDVKVESFQDKKWVLDNRCKIKLDGQSYEGDLSNAERNVTVLSSDRDRTVIKNIKINGCIRLRRKLPKAHIQLENIMVNNQTNFIPLPETKCRHPLFGLNYKKAMKLPSNVAERLREARAETDAAVTPGKKKKKKTREKPDSDEVDLPVKLKKEKFIKSEAPEELTESKQAKKKKKKRKQSIAEEESAPHPKRKKANLESAEAWESEKAIEENLFNF